MYAEEILEYYRHPPNKGVLEHPSTSSHDVNTSCGDELTVSLQITDGKITGAKFHGKGCVISQAACSMLLESVIGKTLDDVRNIDKKDVLAVLGIDVSPMRLKCALLGLKVLKMAVYQKIGERFVDDV